MNRPNIVAAFTGSVATTLAPKVVEALNKVGNTTVVMTKRAENFCERDKVWGRCIPYCTGDGITGKVFTEESEWSWHRKDGVSKFVGYPALPEDSFDNLDIMWQKDDPILHIGLRKWADILVIAPLSANTLAKMATGQCDNLLTSIFRCWDRTKPVVVAPAMNTLMWEQFFTRTHLEVLRFLCNASPVAESRIDNCYVVDPIAKGLACGDVGVGAMAMIEDVVAKVQESQRWMFPLWSCPGIPINFHPGAFGFHRKHSYHTGVDLYVPVKDGSPTRVYAVEPGTVVNIELFTGPQDNTPWWKNTKCILVAGHSGVVCYGEVEPRDGLKIGDRVSRGEVIANVVPVLLEGKERPDIEGHSRYMLHFELYKEGTTRASHSWKHEQPMHGYMMDPTIHLCRAIGAPKERLTWSNPKLHEQTPQE